MKNAVDEKHPARLANRFAGRLFRPEGKQIPTDIAIGNGGDYIPPTYIGASALISNKLKGILPSKTPRVIPKNNSAM